MECRFCGWEEMWDEWEMDQTGSGGWCGNCDSYNYLATGEDNHRFTLILETKSSREVKVSAPSISLSKRLSPYRYPGGKSRLVEYLHAHLRKNRSSALVSPFTGGGSYELAMLHAGVVESIHLNDRDLGVYGLWWTIKHMPDDLISRLNGPPPTHDDFFKARDLIKHDYASSTLLEAAWASLVVNRLAYSGVAKANPLGGRNGTEENLLSRWNPSELCKRIRTIHGMAERIEVTCEDSLDIIEEAYWQQDATLFIDPPYVAKGEALYPCFYTENDHIELAQLLESLHTGLPGADILVTYDECTLIDELYRTPHRLTVGRAYSA